MRANDERREAGRGVTRGSRGAAGSHREGRVSTVRGWPDDGTGGGSSTSAPEADVEALIAWGRFADAAEALARLEQVLPALESSGEAPAVLLALFGRGLLARVAGRPLPEIVEACDLLERSALERRAPVWAACAAALRARTRLDAGEVGAAVNDLARVDLQRLGAVLAERPGLLLLDTLAGAYARLRLDERTEDARSRIEEALPAAAPFDRAVHWAGWSVQLAARALDPVASGRGEPDQALLERAVEVSGRLDALPRTAVPDRLRRGADAVRALAAAYRGRPSEALRLLGQDAFGEARDLPPLERQIAALAAIHAHALVGSVATARSLDDGAAPAPAGLPHLVLEACRARERLWLESHAGGSVVPALTRLDDVLARIGWLGMDLVAQTARQVLEHQALRVESRTDPLTAVGNRRALDEEMRHMLRFTPMPLALVLVDIDDFKQINDAFTHVVGDEVLRRVAECLGHELRMGDHLARYGGDEFIALLPRTGDQEARQVADRMSEAIARLPWGELADGLRVRVTTGSAALWSLTGRRPDRDAENLFRRADEALLEAKRGRSARPPVAAWPVGGRRRRIAAADPAQPAAPMQPAPLQPAPVVAGDVPAEIGSESTGPVTAPVTAPVAARGNRTGHHAHPAHSLQGDDADDVPPETESLPRSRRRRATVIDLSGAASARTPFG
jgi:diguanylate cyclase (GGDEF)-like protein